MLFSGVGRNNPLSQIFQPMAAAKAADAAINAAIAGFLRNHLRPRVKTPLRFAQIGSCLSQCSRSWANARADE